MELLQGKTAIVTGGTRGIGLAVVRVFLQNGARVALFGSRQETADRAVAALKSEEPGWDVIGLAPDLTDFASVQAAVEAVRARFMHRLSTGFPTLSTASSTSYPHAVPAAFEGHTKAPEIRPFTVSRALRLFNHGFEAAVRNRPRSG